MFVRSSIDYAVLIVNVLSRLQQETTCLFFFSPVFQIRGGRLKNIPVAIKSQAHVHVALRGIPLSTFELAFILSWSLYIVFS